MSPQVLNDPQQAEPLDCSGNGTTAHSLRPLESDASPIRARCEAFIPLVLLALQMYFVPLGHPWFPVVAVILSGLVISYLILGLVWMPHSSRRWQLRPPSWNDGGNYRRGFLFLAKLFLVGVGPILALRYLEIPLPNPEGPGLYFAWCLIQDFVFFSLVLRGLADLAHPYCAIGITAMLFGFAHHPNYEMIVGTTLTAGAWGYAFLAFRWLAFVVVSHWAMGLFLLWR